MRAGSEGCFNQEFSGVGSRERIGRKGNDATVLEADGLLAAPNHRFEQLARRYP